MKDIKNWEGQYAITRDGKIWCHRIGRFLKMKTSLVNGRIWYVSVSFSRDGKAKGYKVHRLVAEAFIPNPQKLAEVNHINGKKDDNRVENLEWCSRQYNIRTAWESGLCPPAPKGEKHGSAKFTEELIRKIRREYTKKVGVGDKTHSTSYRKLARRFGLSKSNVEAIVRRVTWNHI